MTEEEYFRKTYPDFCYGNKPLSPYWDFFQDGVEFGERQSEKKIEELKSELTKKADRPQWHDLRKDPTDIPPRKDDTYSVEVWTKNARGHYGTAVFSYACLEDDGKYDHWIGTMPVLWTELPKVEEIEK